MAPANAQIQTPQTGPVPGQSVRTMTPAPLHDPQSWCPRSLYSFSRTAATRVMDTRLLAEWLAVWLTVPRFASTRAWICTRTAASTSTAVRAQAFAALPLSCTPHCSPCPSCWTLGAWRSGLAVRGATLCGKSACSRPTRSLSSWGRGLLWTGRPVCSTIALLLTTTRTFVCTAKHYTTVRDQKRSLVCETWCIPIITLLHRSQKRTSLSLAVTLMSST